MKYALERTASCRLLLIYIYRWLQDALIARNSFTPNAQLITVSLSISLYIVAATLMIGGEQKRWWWWRKRKEKTLLYKKADWTLAFVRWDVVSNPIASLVRVDQVSSLRRSHALRSKLQHETLADPLRLIWRHHITRRSVYTKRIPNVLTRL